MGTWWDTWGTRKNEEKWVRLAILAHLHNMQVMEISWMIHSFIAYLTRHTNADPFTNDLVIQSVWQTRHITWNWPIRSQHLAFTWILIVPLCSLSSTLSRKPTLSAQSSLLRFAIALHQTDRPTDRSIDPSPVGFFIDPMREFVSELREIVHFLWLNSSSKNRFSGWWFYTEQQQQQQQACCTKPWILEGAILLVFCHVSALCHLLRTLCVGFFGYSMMRWWSVFLVLWWFDFDRGCVLLELFI